MIHHIGAVEKENTPLALFKKLYLRIQNGKGNVPPFLKKALPKQFERGKGMRFPQPTIQKTHFVTFFQPLCS
jgi:hypothetical protein